MYSANTGNTTPTKDFKSLVSTYFTIRAEGGDYTFVVRKGKKGKCKKHFPFFYLEREKSLELSTYTLARYRSTN